MKKRNPFVVIDTRYSIAVPMLILALVLFLVGWGFLPISFKHTSAQTSYWTDSGYYALSFGGGNGSSEQPYLISTPQQLARMAYLANTNQMSSGRYFKLTNNISMSKIGKSSGLLNWKPIGNDKYPFVGHFDGDGYVISGLIIKDFSSSDGPQGLFGCAAANSENSVSFQNLKICGTISTNSSINSTNTGIGGVLGTLVGSYHASFSNISSNMTISVPNAYYVGGIVGCAMGGNFSTCTNQNDIVAKGIAGGLIGQARKTAKDNAFSMRNCYNFGDISADGDDTGGLIGQISCPSAINYASVNACYNNGKIVGNNGVGGIVGLSGFNTDIIISNCFNSATIIAHNNNAGGIVGTMNACVSDYSRMIRGCYNFGNVSSSERAGGIVGLVDDNLNVNNCYNSGQIVSESHSGGMIGYCCGTNSTNEIRVSSNTNNGIVSAKKYSGGMVGAIIPNTRTVTSITVQYCLNTSSDPSYISAQYYSGGMVGYISGRSAQLKIYRCKNESKIDGSLIAGGIIGYVYAPYYDVGSGNYVGTIIDCINTAQVGSCYRPKGDGNLVKVPDNGAIKDVANVLGKQGLYYGGIVGYNAESSVKVSNCVNTYNLFPVRNVDPNLGWESDEPKIEVTGQYVGQIIGRNTSDSSPTGKNYYVIEDSPYFLCYPYGNSGKIETKGPFYSKQYRLTYGVKSSNGDEASKNKSSYYNATFMEKIIPSSKIPKSSCSISDWIWKVSSDIWTFDNSKINDGLPYFKAWYW